MRERAPQRGRMDLQISQQPLILRGPRSEMRSRGVCVRRTAQPVVARCGKQRDGASGGRPERGTENGAGIGARLLKVAITAITLLAAVRIAVVTDRDGEPSTASRDLGKQGQRGCSATPLSIKRNDQWIPTPIL